VQFYGGTSRTTWRISRQKLRSFLEELAGSLAAKTVQFLEGTDSWLLGHW